MVDMAANKAEAQRRLADLREKYQHLLEVMRHAQDTKSSPESILAWLQTG